MPLKKTRLRALVLAGGFFLLILVYCAIRLFSAYTAAANINLAVGQISKSHAIENPGSDARLVRQIQSYVSEIVGATHDPIISSLKWLPVVGKDVAAVGETSEVAQSLLDDVIPALDIFEAVDKRDPRRSFANLSNREVMQLDSQVSKTVASLESASNVFDKWGSRQLDFGLAPKFSALHSQLAKLQIGFSRAAPLISLALPVVSTSKTWFIANQNLAEARGTGGIMSSWSIIKVTDGHLKLLASGSDQDLDKNVRVDFHSLPASLRSLWGQSPANWRDINAPRDFSSFAQQIRDSLRAKFKIDGVLAIGQGTVTRLAAAAGAVKAGKVEISAGNAHDFLGKDIYSRFTNVEEKNTLVQAILLEMFGRFANGKFDVKNLWQSLTTQNYGDQVYGWASDARIDKLFAAGGVDGQVSSSFGPKIYFTLNNADAGKLEAYLNIKSNYRLQSCNFETDTGFAGRKASLEIQLRNNAPQHLPAYVLPKRFAFYGSPKGSTSRTLISVYGPVQSTRKSFFFDNEQIFASEGQESGRPVWILDVMLSPGKAHKLVLNWVEPIEDSDHRNIQRDPQLVLPSAFNAIDSTVSSSGPCASKN